MPDANNSDYDPAGTSWGATMQAVGPYLGLGFQIALTMAAFAGLGYLIDRWLGTSPWGVIAGGALGLVAVFVQLTRTTRSMNAGSNDNAPPPS